MALENIEVEAPKKNELIQPKYLERLDLGILFKKIEEFLDLEFIKRSKIGELPVFKINYAKNHAIAELLHDNGFSLATIWASELNDQFQLNYLYQFYPFLTNSSLIFQMGFDKSVDYISISDLYPNAFDHEKNIERRLGIAFKYPKTPEDEKLCIPISFTVKSMRENPYQIGIYNPIHTKRSYVDVYVEDTTITKVDLRDGWLYKKIQPQLEQNPIFDNSGLFDQISNHSNVHLNLAYIQNIEQIFNIKPSNKVIYLRTLIAESERVRSHLIWLINFADLLSHRKIAHALNQLLYKLNSLYEKYFLSANLQNTIRYNSSIDLTMNSAREIFYFWKKYENLLFDTGYGLVYDNFTEEKCSKIGILAKEQAIGLGFTGPALRGSGWSIDQRTTEPYLNYTTGELSQVWNVIAFTKGDVHARAQVRLWEIRESIEIIKNLSFSLSTYDRQLPLEPQPDLVLKPGIESINTVEAPSGALSLYNQSAPIEKSTNFYTTRILSPDFRNFYGLKHLLLNEDINNVPLVIHSLDLNFHMIDL